MRNEGLFGRNSETNRSPGLVSEEFDVRNKELRDELHRKTKEMKNFAITINSFLQEDKEDQEKLKEGYGDLIQSVKGSVKNLSSLLTSGNLNVTCYIILFVLFVFLFLYICF